MDFNQQFASSTHNPSSDFDFDFSFSASSSLPILETTTVQGDSFLLLPDGLSGSEGLNLSDFLVDEESLAHLSSSSLATPSTTESSSTNDCHRHSNYKEDHLNLNPGTLPTPPLSLSPTGSQNSFSTSAITTPPSSTMKPEDVTVNSLFGQANVQMPENLESLGLVGPTIGGKRGSVGAVNVNPFSMSPLGAMAGGAMSLGMSLSEMRGMLDSSTSSSPDNCLTTHSTSPLSASFPHVHQPQTSLHPGTFDLDPSNPLLASSQQQVPLSTAHLNPHLQQQQQHLHLQPQQISQAEQFGMGQTTTIAQRSLKRKSAAAFTVAPLQPMMPQNMMPDRDISMSASGSGSGGGSVGGHNLVERRYRNNINSHIARLRDLVPALHHLKPSSNGGGMDAGASGGRKASQFTLTTSAMQPIPTGLVDGVKAAKKLSKGTILGKSIEYIEFLKGEREELEYAIEQLKLMVIEECPGGEEVVRKWQTEREGRRSRQRGVRAAMNLTGDMGMGRGKEEEEDEWGEEDEEDEEDVHVNKKRAVTGGKQSKASKKSSPKTSASNFKTPQLQQIEQSQQQQMFDAQMFNSNISLSNQFSHPHHQQFQGLDMTSFGALQASTSASGHPYIQPLLTPSVPQLHFPLQSHTAYPPQGQSQSQGQGQNQSEVQGQNQGQGHGHRTLFGVFAGFSVAGGLGYVSTAAEAGSAASESAGKVWSVGKETLLKMRKRDVILSSVTKVKEMERWDLIGSVVLIVVGVVLFGVFWDRIGGIGGNEAEERRKEKVRVELQKVEKGGRKGKEAMREARDRLREALKGYVGLGRIGEWDAMALVRLVEFNLVLDDISWWDKSRLARAVQSSRWPKESAETPLLLSSYVYALLALSYATSEKTSRRYWDMARNNKKDEIQLGWLDLVLEVSAQEAFEGLRKGKIEEGNVEMWNSSESRPLLIAAQTRATWLLKVVWAKIFVELIREKSRPDSQISMVSSMTRGASTTVPEDKLREWNQKGDIDDLLVQILTIVNPSSRRLYLLSSLSKVVWDVWQNRITRSDAVVKEMIKVLKSEDTVTFRMAVACANKDLSGFCKLVELAKMEFKHMGSTETLICATMSYIFIKSELRKIIEKQSSSSEGTIMIGGKEGMELNRVTLAVRLLFNCPVFKNLDLKVSSTVKNEDGDEHSKDWDLQRAGEEWADLIQRMGRRAARLPGSEDDSGVEVD